MLGLTGHVVCYYRILIDTFTTFLHVFISLVLLDKRFRKQHTEHDLSQMNTNSAHDYRLNHSVAMVESVNKWSILDHL